MRSMRAITSRFSFFAWLVTWLAGGRSWLTLVRSWAADRLTLGLTRWMGQLGQRAPRLFLYLSFLALGQNVALAVNEVQHITLSNVTASPVTIGYGGSTTTFVPGDSAAQVQTDLAQLPGLNNNITVSGSSNALGGNGNLLTGGVAILNDPYTQSNGDSPNNLFDNSWTSHWTPAYDESVTYDLGAGRMAAANQLKVWATAQSDTGITLKASNTNNGTDWVTLVDRGFANGGYLTTTDWTADTAPTHNNTFLFEADCTNSTSYRYYNFASRYGSFAIAEVLLLNSGATGSASSSGQYDVTFVGAKANTDVAQMTTTTTGVTITTSPNGGPVLPTPTPGPTSTPMPTPTPDGSPDAPTFSNIGYNHFTVKMPTKPGGVQSLNLQWLRTDDHGNTAAINVAKDMAGLQVTSFDSTHALIDQDTGISQGYVQGNTTYTLRAVSVVNGNPEPGGQASVTTPLQPPDAPGAPTLTFRSCHKLKVQAPTTWPARATSMTLMMKYSAEPNTSYSAAGTVSQAGQQVEIDSYNSTQDATFQGPLWADETYDFYFLAYNSDVASVPGGVLQAKTRPLPGQPAAPVVNPLRATQFTTIAQGAFPQPNPEDSTSFTLQQRELVDEQQTLHLQNVDPDGGNLVVAYHGGTASFAPGATSALVQAALATLPGIGAGNIQVTGQAAPVNPNLALPATAVAVDDQSAAASDITACSGPVSAIFDHDLASVWTYSGSNTLWVSDTLPQAKVVPQATLWATQPLSGYFLVYAKPTAGAADWGGATMVGRNYFNAAQWQTDAQHPGLYSYSLALDGSTAYRAYQFMLPAGAYATGGSYGLADIELQGTPVYTGDYQVEFTRALAGQNVDPLSVDATSAAGLSVLQVRDGQVGDWTVNLLQNVLPGQSNAVQSLIPQTSYQIRWEAVGFDPADVTPSPPTTITTTPPEVDASIQNDGDTDFIGQQIWSLDGDGESVQQAVRVGNAATYHIQVTNGEPTSDDFNITGPGSDANWTVSYFDAQGNDITTQVAGTGYMAHGLGVGQTCNLSVEVAPNLDVAGGTTKAVLVTATIGSDPAQQDAVLATTTALTPQNADALIALPNEATYTGGFIYNLDGTNQTKATIVPPGVAAVYYVEVKNDGTVTDDFSFTGPDGGNGWTVRYFDGRTSTTDITDEVLGEGWIIGSLAPGATSELRVEVTPDDTVQDGNSFDADFSVMAYSDADEDVVKAHTTMSSPTGAGTGTSTVDAMIQNQKEYLWSGSGYSADGTGATSVNGVSPGVTSVYRIRIQNLGTTADTFNVTRQEGDATGWTVRYWDALNGGTEITQAITSAAGWTTPVINPGFTGKIIRVEVTPDAQQTPGAAHPVTVHVTSTSDTTQTDAVKAYTFISDLRPVAEIRNASDSSYIGANVYNLDGTNQTKTQIVGPGTTAVYFLTVANLQNTSDTFTLTATTDPAGGATVKCFNALYFAGQQGGNDITTAVMSNTGWTTSQIAPAGSPGDSVILRMEITPASTAADGTAQNVLITATSHADPTKQDAVKATAIAQRVAQWDAAICNSSDTGYVGSNIYNVDGTNQSKAQATAPGTAAVYAVQATNRGNFSDNLQITGPAGDANWDVRYYDALNEGNDITDEVIGEGWTSPQTVAPGQSYVIRAEVTPAAGVAVGTAHAILINVTSANLESASDVVQATTTATTTTNANPTVDWFFTTDKKPNVSGTHVVIQPIFKSGSNPLASATLTIQGGMESTTLRSWNFAAGTAGSYIARATVWDSTHFSDSTPVTVTAQCTDSAGQTSGLVSYTVNVFNKAYVLGNISMGVGETSWPDSASEVSSLVSTMRYNTYSSNNDHKATILANIPDYTVFSIGTHGGIGELSDSSFGDCFAGLANGQYITNSEVQAQVATKTDQPPYSFVQMFSCMTGGNSKIAAAFGVTGATDRAFLGFDRVCTVDAINRAWTQRVWQYLQQGMTLQDAVDKSNKGGYPMGSNTASGFDRVQIYPEIYGDPMMKVSSVYGGNPGDWHREE